MPDEQTPNEQTTADVSDAASEASTEASRPERDRVSTWFDRLLGRTPQVEPEEGDSSDRQEEPKAEPAKQQPETMTLTQDELDRRVQAETDRREAKRAAEAARAQRKKLADEDPFQLAEDIKREMSHEEAADQVRRIHTNVMEAYDRDLLDPLVGRLPQEEAAKLVKEIDATGTKGRGKLQIAIVDALVKRAKAEGAKEAEAKLRKNPALLKQLLLQDREAEDEPEPTEGTGAGRTGAVDMNNVIREMAGLPPR